jgi:hypothetical protein
MTITTPAPASFPRERPRRIAVDIVHGGVLTAGGGALLFRVGGSPELFAATAAPEVRFAAVCLIFFLASWAATDQAETYGIRLAIVDVIEAGLLFGCLYHLGLFDAGGKQLPNVAMALVLLVVAVFLQLLWRVWAGLTNEPEHYDFRFLMVAAIGYAYVATGSLQVVFLTIAVVLIGIYAMALNTARSRRGGQPRST